MYTSRDMPRSASRMHAEDEEVHGGVEQRCGHLPQLAELGLAVLGGQLRPREGEDEVTPVPELADVLDEGGPGAAHGQPVLARRAAPPSRPSSGGADALTATVPSCVVSLTSGNFRLRDAQPVRAWHEPGPGCGPGALRNELVR